MAWRYVHKAVALPAARAPKPGAFLRLARTTCLFLVLDGTWIRSDRLPAGRPFLLGRASRARNERAGIDGSRWMVVWVSDVLPGSVHDVTAARVWGVPRLLRTAGLPGPGRQGLSRPARHAHPLQGPGQARLPTGRQPLPRPAARPRRTRQRPVETLAHPAQAALPSLKGRPTRQGHPRPTEPRGHHQLKKGSRHARPWHTAGCGAGRQELSGSAEGIHVLRRAGKPNPQKDASWFHVRLHGQANAPTPGTALAHSEQGCATTCIAPASSQGHLRHQHHDLLKSTVKLTFDKAPHSRVSTENYRVFPFDHRKRQRQTHISSPSSKYLSDVHHIQREGEARLAVRRAAGPENRPSREADRPACRYPERRISDRTY
ncbi:hypothetical protein ACRB68_33920 [Actinomadura sp. RB68]|uniref:Transposase n=1 Tax=Actinomadura macrotermitis TaxID=2585200 RepID=A0A7K0BVX1_9ACTN|nr:hypothetical protein [Actinomadura macrotermitis]